MNRVAAEIGIHRPGDAAAVAIRRDRQGAGAWLIEAIELERELLAELRQHCAVPVILGGLHPTFAPEEIERQKLHLEALRVKQERFIAGKRDLLEKIIAASTPGARLAYWNMLAPRSRPESLAARLKSCEADSWFAQDRAFFYSRFVVEEVLR